MSYENKCISTNRVERVGLGIWVQEYITWERTNGSGTQQGIRCRVIPHNTVSSIQTTNRPEISNRGRVNCS